MTNGNDTITVLVSEKKILEVLKERNNKTNLPGDLR